MGRSVVVVNMVGAAVPLRRGTFALLDQLERPLPFEEVYARHGGPIFRFCLSQLGDPAAAEDIAAEVFVSACAAYPRVQPSAEAVRPWLFRIARNAAIDHRRRLFRGRRAVARLHVEGAAPVDVETVAALRADLREVLEAMRSLKRRERQLIGLRGAGGLSWAEIAEVMGMSESAAKMAAHRALQRVRERCSGVAR